MGKKIRILHVLPLGTVGGAEKVVLSLCRNHNKSRFEIIVCILFSGGSVSDEIAAIGHKVIMLNMKNGFDVFKALRLINIVRKHEIDIVHYHGRNPLGKLCSILSGVPAIIQTDHGTTIGSPVKRKKRVVLSSRLLSPFFDRFIAVSEGMKRSLLLREKVPEKKITVIYNGVDTETISSVSYDKVKLKESLDIPSGIPILGMVGRLADEKQHSLLFDSLSLLKKEGVDFLALIIGDGPQKDALEALIEKLNLKDRVRFLGERKDVPSLLEIIDVFVFSSAGEAFSLTLLEAMAKAKPIVAFDVEGINEAVVSNQTGFLVPFGDTEEFAKKINLLLDSPGLAGKMGQTAYERVTTMFNLKGTIRKTEELYESLVQNIKT